MGRVRVRVRVKVRFMAKDCDTVMVRGARLSVRVGGKD